MFGLLYALIAGFFCWKTMTYYNSIYNNASVGKVDLMFDILLRIIYAVVDFTNSHKFTTLDKSEIYKWITSNYYETIGFIFIVYVIMIFVPFLFIPYVIYYLIKN